MTFRAHIPTRHNREYWTAYERSREGVGFDNDGWSSMTTRGDLLNIPTDWDDITILSGLESSS